MTAVPPDNSIHLRCFESTHEMLLEQGLNISDMILSDCPLIQVSYQVYTVKAWECHMGFL